jgi:hypothetical protein
MQSLKKTNKQFFTRLLLVVLFCISVDQLTGVILYYFFSHQTSGEFAIANHVAYKMDEEILVLGSSRASHHYNASRIKNGLTLSCFNGGRDGEGLLYSTAMLELALQYHKPKVVILDMNSDALSEKEDERDKLSILLPYLKQSDAIKNILVKKGRFELLKSFSQAYCYNGQVFSIVQHYFLPSRDAVMGFNPLTDKMDVRKSRIKQPMKPYSDHIAADNENALNLFINKCRLENIQLFVFISPRYNDDTSLNSYVKIKSICENKNVIFHDYTNDASFKNPEYYSDRAHLNSKGADLFTDTVVAFIKNKLIPLNNLEYLGKK